MNDFRPELITILKGKVTEGLDVIRNLNIGNENYARAIMDLLNTDKTVADLEAQLAFDAEQKAKEIEEVEKLLEGKEDFVMGGE